MKTSSVILILVALVLIYIAYVYLVKPKSTSTTKIVTGNSSSTNTNTTCDDSDYNNRVKAARSALDKYTIEAQDDLQKYNDLLSSYLNGATWVDPNDPNYDPNAVILNNSITQADLDEAKLKLDSAIYNYKTALINYNGISGSKCGALTVQIAESPFNIYNQRINPNTRVLNLINNIKSARRTANK